MVTDRTAGILCYVTVLKSAISATTADSFKYQTSWPHPWGQTDEVPPATVHRALHGEAEANKSTGVKYTVFQHE